MMQKYLFFLSSYFALSLSGCNITQNPKQAVTDSATPTGQAAEMAQEENTITEKRWKLVELEGHPVTTSEHQNAEAHVVLHTAGSKVSGNGSCNVLNGSYTLSEGNRIRFSKMATTRMYCPEMKTEEAFLKVLELADNYSLNGDTLLLNVGRRAPLAVFHAVYLE